MMYKGFDQSKKRMKNSMYRLVLLLGLLGLNRGAQAADTQPPTVQTASPVAGSTVSNLTQITVTFSEPVNGVHFSDLLLNGAPAADVSGADDIYTFTFPQPPCGTIRISWDPGHTIFDLSDPPNRFDETAPAASWQYILVDLTPPAVEARTPAAGVAVKQLTQVEVIFAESVEGVEAADLLINGTPAASLTVLSSRRYLFGFPQPTNGLVQVAWVAGHGIRDLAAVPNAFAGGAWTYTLDPMLGLPDVRINEFVAANVSGLLDENNEAQDWIEIYNRGATTVNLDGWGLTDDPDDPGKWTFPATNLAPGQYLVVFASAKDRRVPGARLHTNFKLNATGDYLGLFNAESPRVAVSEFAPEFPEQRNDYSYGYDSLGVLKYFRTPTPGAANGNSAITGIVPPPHFNVGRGLFDAPFTLILNTPIADATILYTVDGSEPTATNGFTYTAPLQITNTTVLRAAAFRTNMVPSVTVTHTYLFLDSVLRQPNNPPGYPVGTNVWTGYPSDYEMDPEIVTNATYGPMMKAALQALPTVSIVMKEDDMFGPNNGIYTHPEPPANQRYLWERPCSVEMILTNGGKGFQVNCGVRIQGNASRTPQKTPKHPFRLMFRGDYGPGRLEYPIFPGSPVTSFDTIVLRADFNNSWLHWDANQRLRGTRLRDAWTKETFREMGQASGHTRHFHLYINGLYWGVYDFGERIDAEFAASYMGGLPEEYDVMASKPTEAINGDMTAYNAMVSAVRTPDMRQLTNYTRALQYLDMTNFIDYTLLNFYGANQDWGYDGNWNAARRRAPGELYKYLVWDGEQLIVLTNDNRITSTDLPSGFHTNLVKSPEYLLAFADRVQKHMFDGGALTTNAVIPRWQYWATQVVAGILGESARWGDYRRDVAQYSSGPYYLYTFYDHWLPEINRMVINYFPQRHAIFLQQLRAAGLYPNVTAPSFNQHGGRISRGFNLTMAAANPIYYTTDGSDPRVYGTGAISPTAQTYGGPVVLNSSMIVKARALSGTNWSALNEANFTVDMLGVPLRITEIMYNPVGGDAYEFLELQNVGNVAIDISGFSFVNIVYTFPPQTFLAPGAVIVLGSSSSPGNWTNRYPGVAVFGRFDGTLSNGGEKLAILDPHGNTVYSLDYDDERGWPTAADGQGYSLEVIDPFGDPDDPANWRASAVTNGTPGIVSPPPTPGAVVLNEVMADNLSAVNNGGTFPDWIELYNSGAQAVDLSGWSLTDDGNPRKFVFPTNTTVAAGGYLVLWCDSATNTAPGLHAGFALGRNGETVSLYDAGIHRVDALTFGLQVPDYSVGRVNGQWQLTLPTTNAPNQAAPLAASTNLVINEWLANAAPGGSDWIELYNPATNAPAPLHGTYVGISNTTFQITSLSFVPAGGFVQLFADEKAGADHLDFKLPATGGAIVFYDETGTERDRVTYGAQTEGVTQGRLPDGSATVRSFPGSPSPRASNYLLVYTGPVLNELMAINDGAVTNALGVAADWVELYNPNGTNFDLSGMRLSTDANKPDQWFFPPGTVVPAGGYLVVWFDGARPASLAPDPVLNTGHSLDGESGELVLFNSAGQPVDSVAYGFQVADLSIGRSAGQWQLLASPTPGAPNAGAAVLGSAASLRINEWMANPLDGNDWFELYNADTQPVQLDGLYLGNSPSAVALTQFEIPSLSFIGALGFVKFVADADPSDGRNHVNFNLDAEGEVLRLYSPALGVIDIVYFGLQLPGVSEGLLPDGEANVVQFPTTASPAAGNYLPLPDLVINEALTHTDPPLEDAIEIANLGATPVDLSGWYLSNSRKNLRKYRIPDGTLVPAGGLVVFYEYQFNAANPGTPFTLNSAQGDEVWLTMADAHGTVQPYRTSVSFGAAENGVSFGRYQTSVGTDFTALSRRTFGVDDPASLEQFRSGGGQANAYPKVGPVVINEIMYHPPDIGGTNDNTLDEYIELYNLSGSTVLLYDPAYPANTWRLQDGVTFAFPQSTSIPAGGFLLLVNFDPVNDPFQLAVFRGKFGVPPEVPVFGPYGGKLDNGGEAIELAKPDSPQAPPHPDAGLVPYIRVDRVAYSDRAPWPSGADGSTNGVGISLQRRVAAAYGNEPLNWLAGSPTPGVANGPAMIALPGILQQPQSQSVIVGADVSLAVDAGGDGPLSYQWRFNGVDLAGATNAALMLPDIQVSQHGDYTVWISNPAGSVLSAPAALSVSGAVVILRQPQTRGASVGATVLFTVTAQGGGLNYQWRRNGADVIGATGPALTLTNVQLSDAGAYSVVVSNSFGAVTSDDAYLVMTPPSVLVPPQSQTSYAGTNTTLTVTVTGDPPFWYQWRREGVALRGATNATVTLMNVQPIDSGNYDVVVFNAAGSATSAPAALNVIIPVRITQQPQSVATRLGSNVTFTVAAYSTTPITYQWRWNGVEIPGATNTSLLVTNVQVENAGAYQVLVSDAISEVFSTPAVLTPLSPITFTQSPTNQTVLAGSTASFYSAIVGYPPPFRFEFRKVSLPLTSVETYQSNCTFTLTNVQYADQAQYRIVAYNQASPGGVMKAATLTVLSAPIIANQPTNQCVNPGSNITFTVTVVGTTNFAYQWYFNGTNPVGAAVINTPSGTNVLTLTNVQPEKLGDYSVVVTNNYGAVTSQVASLVFREPPGIVVQPTNTTVVAGSNAVFKVQAAGGGPYWYRWYFNGTNTQPNWINDTLTLPSVQPASAGPYFVVVTNAMGSVTSEVAVLTVLTPPTILVSPASQTVAVGSNVTFRVTAGGTEPLTCQWWFNGTNSLPGQTSESLVLSDVQIAQAGIYNVGITNPVGSAPFSTNAYLTVVIPPADQVVRPGSNAAFEVTAVGSALIRYQWQWNGTNLSNATSSTLTLTNVQAGQAGSYAVVVSVITNVPIAPAVFTVSLAMAATDTVLSQPQLLADGTFRMLLEGAPNQNYVIEISTDLAEWTALATLNYTNGAMPFIDASATNAAPAQRFYRARSAP